MLSLVGLPNYYWHAHLSAIDKVVLVRGFAKDFGLSFGNSCKAEIVDFSC